MNNKKKYVLLKNNSGKIKKCKQGFSWDSFLFLIFSPLFRLDIKSVIIQCIIIIIISNITVKNNDLGVYLYIFMHFYFGFNYNKIYINNLIKKGYVIIDDSKEKNNNSTKLQKVENNTKELSRNISENSTEDIKEKNIDNTNNDFSDLNNDSINEFYYYDEKKDKKTPYISISLNDLSKKHDFELNEKPPQGYNNILKSQKVVGVFYENREEFVQKFIFGEKREIILEREPENKYDKNAIKVIGKCYYHNEFITGEMGYLNRQTARQLKDMKSICATINYLDYPDKVYLNIHINDTEFNIYNNYKLKYREMDKFKDLSYHENKKAMEYEEDDNIEKAIEHYEKAIGYNFTGSHPYNRLAILYRKNKDYDNEIRVLKKAIEVYEIIEKVCQNESQNIKLDKFIERLNKATLLKEKHNKKYKV